MSNKNLKEPIAYSTAAFFLCGVVYMAHEGDLIAAKDFNRTAGALSLTSSQGSTSTTAYCITLSGHGSPYAKTLNVDALIQGQRNIVWMVPYRG